MFDGEEYSSPEMELNLVQNTKKRKNKNNKRRFSDEQIRSLETMFESDTKLEPRQKLQLARELGLQPRQVAIWFQNRRARWKSKQLETDYSILQASYNSLASKFEALKKENQSLLVQIQKLNDQMQKSRQENHSWKAFEGKKNDGDLDYREKNCINCDSEEKPNLSLEALEDDVSTKTEYFGFEESKSLLVDMAESADGSLTSTENWGNFDTDSLFDESSSNYQWWDFWS